MNRATLFLALGVTAFVLSAIRCSKSYGEPKFVQALLPNAPGEGACDGPVPAPALCQWILEFDAILVGNIVSVHAVSSPSITDGGPPRSECTSGVLDEAAVLRVRPIAWLWNAPENSSDDVYVAMSKSALGAIQATVDLSGTVPRIVRIGTNELVLDVGASLGLPLMRVDASLLASEFVDSDGLVWSASGGHPFTFDGAGMVIAAKGGECGPVHPDFDGWSFDKLVASVDACTAVAPTQQTINLHDVHKGTQVGETYAARCYADDPGITTRACSETQSCPMGYCEKGFCECHGAEICTTFWSKAGF